MKVVHCKRQTYTHYIGRPSALGNPFVIGRDGTRAEVIAKFKAYALKTPSVLQAIQALPEQSILGCWCSPQACHGDVIIELWNKIRS